MINKNASMLSSKPNNFYLLLLLSVFLMGFLIICISPASAANLQQMIDNTPSGGIIILKKGTYYGPITIKKPITINGSNVAIINGRHKGNVITIKSNHVTLENLTIENSGNAGWAMDAGIAMYSSYNHIIHNRIKDVLYGIQARYANYNLIKDNNISSRPWKEVGLRGDGMRLWWSNYNMVVGNYVHQARDLVIWFCIGDIIKDEKSVNDRYGIHFMYSNYDSIINYTGEHDSVGIYLMYTNRVIVKNALIKNNNSVTGIGIGMKSASNVLIENAAIVHCTWGVYIDESPYEPNSKCEFIDDRFLYNGVAMYFNTDITRWDNVFMLDDFAGNIKNAYVTGGMVGHKRGIWKYNYWDTYEGFDDNHDGVGDTPYVLYDYAGSLTHHYQILGFFRGSPVMSFINFMRKLVPFSKPKEILHDSYPLMKPLLPINPEILNIKPPFKIPKKGKLKEQWWGLTS